MCLERKLHIHSQRPEQKHQDILDILKSEPPIITVYNGQDNKESKRHWNPSVVSGGEQLPHTRFKDAVCQGRGVKNCFVLAGIRRIFTDFMTPEVTNLDTYLIQEFPEQGNHTKHTNHQIACSPHHIRGICHFSEVNESSW